jgi:drug/metabolite transporter (DMT)-like permease
VRATVPGPIGLIPQAALAFAIVGLEAGFLIPCRAGGKVTTAGLISNTSIAMPLVPVGWAIFRERPTPVNGLGILIGLVGLALVNWA